MERSNDLSPPLIWLNSIVWLAKFFFILGGLFSLSVSSDLKTYQACQYRQQILCVSVHRVFSPPWRKSSERRLAAVTLRLMEPPCLKNIEPADDIILGTCHIPCRELVSSTRPLPSPALDVLCITSAGEGSGLVYETSREHAGQR